MPALLPGYHHRAYLRGLLLAQLRGRTWHAPRGLGASHRAAAVLIGSILVLLPTGSALATPASAIPAQSASRLPQQAAHASTPDHAAAASSQNADPGSTYTAQDSRPAESLWSIAERQLGNGERWREIAALNEGRTMADGQVFKANSFPQPGWQLEMPDAAGSAGGVRTQLVDGAKAAAGESKHVVTVRSGDYLSKIAEEELGDGNQWPELFEASRGKPQPDGLPTISDPDVVYAGQQVTVPGGQPERHDPSQGSEHGDEESSPQPLPRHPEARRQHGRCARTRTQPHHRARARIVGPQQSEQRSGRAARTGSGRCFRGRLRDAPAQHQHLPVSLG
ncbi:LysM peptidoglycan-binding domain-containing protein [Streptomyces mirabilis]|uniref:LysM peptidoglycan-binding domain-containing protein n=1 Tax=Streptomyces mirabilis TaxID=68239 RepID=UPI0033BC77EC